MPSASKRNSVADPYPLTDCPDMRVWTATAPRTMDEQDETPLSQA